MSRRRMMFTKKKESAINWLGYVAEGLIACFDGEYNTRAGSNSTSKTWEDLSGNDNDATFTKISKGSNYMVLYDDNHNGGNLLRNLSTKTELTVEVVFKPNAGETGFTLLTVNSSYLLFVAGTQLFLYGLTQQPWYIDGYEALTSLSVRYGTSPSLTEVRLNNSLAQRKGTADYWGIWSYPQIGSREGYTPTNSPANKFAGNIYSIRVYDRPLSEEEININYANDKKRFGV